MLRGKTVAVTGAGGSIGSALCDRILRLCAARLILVSLTESALYNVERRLRALGYATELVPVLGSVLDGELMREVLAVADIVIHAAAHKHVPICEANPLAAIENNVGGTYNVASAAIAAGVPHFVLISTDKAVYPASVMGATKRTAELIVRALGSVQRTTRFRVVRFGNVLDSAGSVLPLWREQIAQGGPVTLTDPGCERYFMSIDNAVDLILGALAIEPEGTFVFDMGRPRKLLDMAEAMIADSGRPVRIEYVGLRPGEKLTEQLHFGGTLTPTSNPRILRVEDTTEVPLSAGQVLHLLAAMQSRDTITAVRIVREIAA